MNIDSSLRAKYSPIILKTQRTVGKHVLFVIFQMIGSNAEYPCCKGAVASERGQVRNHFQQDILCGILRIRKCAQHPQG